jgi:hypothetical protein
MLHEDYLPANYPPLIYMTMSPSFILNSLLTSSYSLGNPFNILLIPGYSLFPILQNIPLLFPHSPPFLILLTTLLPIQ